MCLDVNAEVSLNKRIHDLTLMSEASSGFPWKSILNPFCELNEPFASLCEDAPAPILGETCPLLDFGEQGNLMPLFPRLNFLCYERVSFDKWRSIGF